MKQDNLDAASAGQGGPPASLGWTLDMTAGPAPADWAVAGGLTRGLSPRFGEVLCELRQGKELTQRALTHLLLDQRMPNADYHGRISKIEGGKLKPPRDRGFYEGLGRAGFTREEIARLLRCPDAPRSVDGLASVPTAAPTGHRVQPLLVESGGLRAELRISFPAGTVPPAAVRSLYRTVRPLLTLALGRCRDTCVTEPPVAVVWEAGPADDDPPVGVVQEAGPADDDPAPIGGDRTQHPAPALSATGGTIRSRPKRRKYTGAGRARAGRFRQPI